MLGVAAASSLTLDHPDDGGLGVHFEIDTLTLVALAMIWLPALLRLIGLTGGTAKAVGLEVSSDGLLVKEERLIDSLSELRSTAESGSLKTLDSDVAFKQLSEDIDRFALEFLGDRETLNGIVADSLADAYESVREGMGAGEPRTIQMTRIVNEVRIRASANPSTVKRLAAPLLGSEREGRRIVALALLQEVPEPALAEQIVNRISDSASAFEMFNALLALIECAPLLPDAAQRSAIDALESQRLDPREVGVMEDPNLPRLIDQALALLR